MNRKYSIVWRLDEASGKRGKKAEALLCRALIKKYAQTENLAKKLIRKNGLPMLGIDGDNINTSMGRVWKSAKITGSQDLTLSGFPSQPPTGEGIEWKLENIWIPKDAGSQSDVYVLWTNYAKESVIWRKDNKDRQQILWKFHCKDDTNKKEERLFNVKASGQKGKSGEWLDSIYVDDDRDSLAALKQALESIRKGHYLSDAIYGKNPKRAIYAIDKYIKARLSDGNNFSVRVNMKTGTATCSSYRVSNRIEDSKIDYRWVPNRQKKGVGQILVTSGDVTYSIAYNRTSGLIIKKYSGDDEQTVQSNQLLPPHHLYNSVVDEDWYEEVKSAVDERFVRLCGAIVAHRSTLKEKDYFGHYPDLEKLMTIDQAFGYATGTKDVHYMDGYTLPTNGLIEPEEIKDWGNEGLQTRYLYEQGLIKKMPKIHYMEWDSWDDDGKMHKNKGRFYKGEEFEWTFDPKNDKKKPLDWFEGIIRGNL